MAHRRVCLELRVPYWKACLDSPGFEFPKRSGSIFVEILENACMFQLVHLGVVRSLLLFAKRIVSR